MANDDRILHAMVLRYTDYPGSDIEHKIDVKGVYESVEIADSEAERLNALPQRRGRVHYFVKIGALRGPGGRRLSGPDNAS